jgi:aryl-alcohol dehydrogenase-like predicted oxidoreductase
MTAETKFPADDWRSKYFSPANLKNTLARVDNLKSVLPKNMSLPATALRFILSNPTVSTTIIGMRKPDHVRQNIAVSDAGPLNADVLQNLKKHRWDRTPQPWSD